MPDLNDRRERLIRLARGLAAEKFAPRAAHYDRAMTFPREDFDDLFHAGLLALAKVTPDEAKAAGTAAYDGAFKYVKIHNYGGNLAYEVEFKDGLEIVIDAGNKAILQLRIEKGSAFDKARAERGK